MTDNENFKEEYYILLIENKNLRANLEREISGLNEKIRYLSYDKEVVRQRKMLVERFRSEIESLTGTVEELNKNIKNLRQELNNIKFENSDIRIKYGQELTRNENLSARMEQLTKYLKMVGVIELEKQIEILKDQNPNTILKNQLSIKDKIIKKLMKYKYKYEISKK